MELRNLITFIHVAELGSFTKAAQQLDYSQSTVSFQIKQLEDELDCLLFERINHTVTLTEKGHELVSYAHKIRSLTDEFKENMAKDQILHGHIHIGTPDSVCENMILNKYMNFHKLYPQISLTFTTADTAEMVAMLDRNEADAIITLDSHLYNRDYIIAAEQALGTHFVTSPSSPLAEKKKVSLDELLKEPFILTEYGQGYRRVLERELAKKSLAIHPILEIGRTDMIVSTIMQSNMISFLPDFITEDMVKAGKLVYLNVNDIHIDIWKQLIYHKNKWMSKSFKTFIDYVIHTEFTK